MRLLPLRVALAALLIGCGNPSGPSLEGEFIRVPAPAILDRSPFRTIGIKEATLHLRGESSSSGTFSTSETIWVQDTGKSPVETARGSTGTYGRLAQELVLRHRDGSIETFRIEGNGSDLVLTASHCAGPCLAILHLYTYRRSDLVR